MLHGVTIFAALCIISEYICKKMKYFEFNLDKAN